MKCLLKHVEQNQDNYKIELKKYINMKKCRYLKQETGKRREPAP